MTRQDNAAPSQIERRAVLAAVKTAKRRLRRWPSASPDCCSTRRKWDEQAGAKKRRSKPNKETLISKKGLAKSSAIKERGENRDWLSDKGRNDARSWTIHSWRS